jgi:TB2/DP1, HVA22 family
MPPPLLTLPPPPPPPLPPSPLSLLLPRPPPPYQVYMILDVAERYFGSHFSWVPFYAEGKLAVVCWLMFGGGALKVRER